MYLMICILTHTATYSPTSTIMYIGEDLEEGGERELLCCC